MKLKLSILFALSLLIFSCKVSWVPTRSEQAISQVKQAAQSTDSLYNVIITSSDKSYNTYAEGYQDINLQITQILLFDASRNNSKRIVEIATDIHNTFLEYQTKHKNSGTLNNSQLQTNKDYLHALFSALYNAENHFK